MAGHHLKGWACHDPNVVRMPAVNPQGEHVIIPSIVKEHVEISTQGTICWIQLFNCVLSLTLQKCHISCQLVLTEITWSAR